MTGISSVLLFSVFPLYDTEEQVVNELYTLIEKGAQDPASSNHTRLMVKEPTSPINELFEKSSKSSESKLNFHPIPSAMWPKHSNSAPVIRHHGPNKSKKGHKSDHLTEHNSEKNRGEVIGLLPKIQFKGATSAGSNRTAQKPSQDTQTHISPPQQGEPEGHPNSKPKTPAQTQTPTQTHQTASSSRRDSPNRRQDPEENRPGRSGLYQSRISSAAWNNSRPPIFFSRQSSSSLYQFDVSRRESDYTHDAFCVSECRKEKDEREHYCYSEFAVNGIVHDIDVLRKGVRLITSMVGPDGFYKLSRLYVAPDSFFFKVHLSVSDTYKCSKPCPDIKLGARYIVMGQIYHRRRHLPADLSTSSAGKLKPGDGLSRSSSYVKRFNKRRHQKASEAVRSRCR